MKNGQVSSGISKVRLCHWWHWTARGCALHLFWNWMDHPFLWMPGTSRFSTFEFSEGFLINISEASTINARGSQFKNCKAWRTSFNYNWVATRLTREWLKTQIVEVAYQAPNEPDVSVNGSSTQKVGEDAEVGISHSWQSSLALLLKATCAKRTVDSDLEEDSAKVRENGDAAKEAGCFVLAVNQKRWWIFLIFLIGHPSGCRGWGEGRLPCFKHNPRNSILISWGWGTGKSHRAVALAWIVFKNEFASRWLIFEKSLWKDPWNKLLNGASIKIAWLFSFFTWVLHTSSFRTLKIRPSLLVPGRLLLLLLLPRQCRIFSVRLVSSCHFLRLASSQIDGSITNYECPDRMARMSWMSFMDKTSEWWILW